MAMGVMKDRPQEKVTGDNLLVEVMTDRILIILKGEVMVMTSRVLGLDTTDPVVTIRGRSQDMEEVLLLLPGMEEHHPRLQLVEECPPWS